MKKSAHTKFELLKALVKSGAKIFTFEQARAQAIAIGICPSRLKDMLYALKKAKWIQSLKKGLYAITLESGFQPVPHEYEIATALVKDSAIGYWSALHYHHLTQQIPITVFVLVPTNTSIPKSRPIPNIHFIQIKASYFFGIETAWIGESKIRITDPERTLIDGLIKPQHYGDFQEVLYAFEMRGKNLNLPKIIDYACRLDAVVSKRLGFILESLGYPLRKLKRLIEIPMKGNRKLDVNGPSYGPINQRWQVKENI